MRLGYFLEDFTVSKMISSSAVTAMPTRADFGNVVGGEAGEYAVAVALEEGVDGGFVQQGSRASWGAACGAPNKEASLGDGDFRA
jgi:hypothetical protein